MVTADPAAAAMLESAVPLACMNCAAPLAGHYCANCGQEARIETPTVREFVREFLQDQLALEGKLLRTLRVLVGLPGQLTLDYIDGRRQRYLRPLRLYLMLSVVYFAVSGFTGSGPSTPDHVHKQAAAASDRVDRAPAADVDVDTPPAPKAAPADAAPPAPAAGKRTHPAAKAADANTKPAASDGARSKDDLVELDHGDYDQMRDFKTGYVPLDERIKRFFDRPQQRAVDDFNTALRNDAPVAIFFVLPLFAALLKLGYLRHHLRYGVHLLFSLHVHAFVFFDLLLSMLPWPSIINAALVVAIPAYLVLALRRVYGGGWWSTGFFVALLLLMYSVFIGVALVLAAVVSVAVNA
ncbi:MAG: hypothetical protein JWR16_531 [Nevskia sp.]|nr:hypothetical protein [Nevskia sp.]